MIQEDTAWSSLGLRMRNPCDDNSRILQIDLQ